MIETIINSVLIIDCSRIQNTLKYGSVLVMACKGYYGF